LFAASKILIQDHFKKYQRFPMSRFSVSKVASHGFLALAVMVGLCSGTSVFAASVFVTPPTAEGEDATLRASLYELVKAAVSDESGYSLAGSLKEADLTLHPRLLKLGSSYIVSLDKMKGERIVHTAKMKAASAEDIDAVSARVVRAALRETKAAEDAQVGDVTQDEVSKTNLRIQTTRQWKLGFGPAWGDQMNVDKSGILFTLGFVWGIDPNFDLDLGFRTTGFEKSGESGAHFTEFLIGTNYYLTRSRNAPFLTAGVGRTSASVSIPDSTSILNTSDDTINGWSVRVGVGYKFFRTSTVNLGVEANYSKVFGESTRSKQAPGLTSLALALYY
jgi:opacity protein-like surface antigen